VRASRIADGQGDRDDALFVRCTRERIARHLSLRDAFRKRKSCGRGDESPYILNILATLPQPRPPATLRPMESMSAACLLGTSTTFENRS